MEYVTARGWEDFSHLLYSYETLHLPVSKEIVYEYLHHKDVAEDVAAYVDLYRKYQDDYGIDEILQGKVKPAVFARIYEAGFDERLSVVNLLLDGLFTYFQKTFFEKNVTDAYFDFLKSWRKETDAESDFQAAYERRLKTLSEDFWKREKDGFTDKEEKERVQRLTALLKEGRPPEGAKSLEEAFAWSRRFFEQQRMRLEESEEAAEKALEFAFDFMEEAFEAGEEMVVFVTELTVSKGAAAFLAEYSCERYLLYSSQLLIGSRKRELLQELGRV